MNDLEPGPSPPAPGPRTGPNAGYDAAPGPGGEAAAPGGPVPRRGTAQGPGGPNDQATAPPTATAAGGGGGVRRVLGPASRRAALVDVPLWAALAFPVCVGMMPPRPQDPGWWAQGGGLAALAVAIAVGRAWPLVPLTTVVGLLLVHANFVFAMPVAAYLTGRRMRRARPVLWTFTTIFVAGSVLNTVRGIEVTVWFPLTIYLVLLGVLPWLAGRYWRQYQELLHAGWERAERLEHQQRIVAERERLRERSRIAQDMHDSLGHELALIAVRAGALQVAPGLGERHRAAAAELRAGAAQATEHLREIIGVLREGTRPDTAAHPAATLDQEHLRRPARESIADLVERAHASGIPVRLIAPDPAGGPAGLLGGPSTGPPGADGPEPVPMVVLAAHRVVQEALTNAAKHAPGAPVTVRLTRTGDAITVSVVNLAPAGPPLLPPSTAAGTPGGHGLAGLAERLRLVGGTLRTGPTPEGGFEVTAELPVTPAAAMPDPGAPDGPDAAATGVPPEGTESESARRLARERHRLRQGLLMAIAVPAALVAVLSAVMVGYYVYATMNSVLPPDRYAALRVGADRAEVERALPRRELIGSEARRAEYPEPRGTLCRYYRPDANVLGLGRVYRLCFAADRLAYKDVLLPPASGEPDTRGS